MNIFKKFLVGAGLFLTAWIVPAQQGCGYAKSQMSELAAVVLDDELSEGLVRIQGENSRSGSSLDVPLLGEVVRSQVPTPLSQRASSLRMLGNGPGLLSSLSGSGVSPSYAWIESWMGQSSRGNANSAPAAVGTKINPIASSGSLDDFADLEEALFAETEADLGQEGGAAIVPSLSDSAMAISSSNEDMPVLADFSVDEAASDSVISSLMVSPLSVSGQSSSDEGARMLLSLSPASRLIRASEKFLVKLDQQKERCMQCIDRHSFIKEMVTYYRMLHKKMNSPLDSALFVRHNQKIMCDSVAVVMHWRTGFLKNEVVALDRLIQCLYRGITPPEMQEATALLKFYGKEDEEGPLVRLAKLQDAVFAKLAECAASHEVVWNQPEAWLFSRAEFDDFRARHAEVMATFKNVVVRDLERALRSFQSRGRSTSLEDWNDRGPTREFCEGILRHPVTAAAVCAKVTWHGISRSTAKVYYGACDASQVAADMVVATGEALQVAARACASPVETFDRARGRRDSFDMEKSRETDRKAQEDMLFRKIRRYCKNNRITLNEIPSPTKESMLAEWRHIRALKDASYRRAFIEASAPKRPFSAAGAYAREAEFTQIEPAAAVTACAALTEESIVDFLDGELELLGEEAVC